MLITPFNQWMKPIVEHMNWKGGGGDNSEPTVIDVPGLDTSGLGADPNGGGTGVDTSIVDTSVDTSGGTGGVDTSVDTSGGTGVDTSGGTGGVDTSGGTSVDTSGGTNVDTSIVDNGVDTSGGTNVDTSGGTNVVDNTPTYVTTNYTAPDLSGLASGTQVDSGFSQVGSGIDTLSTDLNTGFGNVNTGISGVSGQVSGVGDQVAGVSGQVSDVGLIASDTNTQVAALGEALQNEFGLTTEQITKLSQDVLSGQASLTEIVNDLQKNKTNNFGSLSEGQANIQATTGGLQTGLDSFQNQYKGDADLANQSRQALMDNITGGFDTATEQRSTNSALGEKQRGQIQATQEAMSPAGTSLVGNQAGNPTMFAGVARNLAQGVAASTPEAVTQQNSFISNLNAIKASLTDQNVSLTDEQSASYSTIANSFDQNGKLIAESQDGQGNTVARAIDAQGVLYQATFDQQGNRINQNQVSIDSVLNDASQTLGSSGLMGQQQSNLI